MENDKLIYGLAGRHYRDIEQVFRRYPNIERVLIFGSRAKGTDKPYSDIDLAVVAPNMGDQEFTRLWNELDGLELVFKLDVLHWDRLGQQYLKDSIMTHGQIFYPRGTELVSDGFSPPFQNKKDLEDIPADILKKVRIVPVQMVEEALKLALEKYPPAAPHGSKKPVEKAAPGGTAPKSPAKPRKGISAKKGK